jgi:hypothetical protein
MNIQDTIIHFEEKYRASGGIAMVLRYASYDLICDDPKMDKLAFIDAAAELGYNRATARIQFNISLKDYAALEAL